VRCSLCVDVKCVQAQCVYVNAYVAIAPVCCSVLQYVAVCCSVLAHVNCVQAQRVYANAHVAVCCSVAVYYIVL